MRFIFIFIFCLLSCSRTTTNVIHTNNQNNKETFINFNVLLNSNQLQSIVSYYFNSLSLDDLRYAIKDDYVQIDSIEVSIQNSNILGTVHVDGMFKGRVKFKTYFYSYNNEILFTDTDIQLESTKLKYQIANIFLKNKIKETLTSQIEIYISESLKYNLETIGEMCNSMFGSYNDYHFYVELRHNRMYINIILSL